MFLGFVFPGLGNVSKEYWQGFLGRAFFAPAYILMLYFAHQILVNMQEVVAAGSQGFAKAFGTKNAVEAANTFESTIVFFIITSVFLIAALVIAQKMGAVGASNAIAIGKRFAGSVGNNTKYAALAPVRKTARYMTGGAANIAGKINDRLQTTPGGRFAKKALSVASLGSFTERERLAAIEAGKTAKFGGKYSYQDDQDFKKKTQQRENDLTQERKRKEDFTKSFNLLNDVSTELSGGELKTALVELAKTMRDMTKGEKENMSVSQLSDKTIAINLSDSDLEGLEKSGKFGAQDIKSIKTARSDAYKAVADVGSALPTTVVNRGHADVTSHQREALMNKSAQEVGKMPTDLFFNPNMVSYINPRALEEKLRNGGVSNDDQEKIKNNLQSYINDPGTEKNKRDAWRKWTETSTYGSGFGLNIPRENQDAPNAPPATSPIVVEPGYRARPRT